jgi:hypothetical protein
MAESNPMRWVVLGVIAAGLFTVGILTLVQSRVDAAKAQAAAAAEASEAAVARADEKVTAELDRAAAVAGPFVAEVGKGLYGQAYARMAAPYRAAASPDIFAKTCQSSPLLAGARRVVLRRLWKQASGATAALTADGVLDSAGGAVPVSFVFLDEPPGPRILTVLLAGVPVLQGVAPAR